MISGLVDFAKENPGVVVYVKPRRHRTPVIVAEYLNGEKQWINCRNNTSEELTKWMTLLKTQAGDHTDTRYRKMQSTFQPSIQGVWTPFTNKNPLLNIVELPEEKLSEPLTKQKTATEQLLEIFKQQKLEDSTSEK
jgi:large subunit ribosomal protein L43